MERNGYLDAMRDVMRQGLYSWDKPHRLVVRAIRPCVVRWNENNTITMMPFSEQYGCTEPDFLIVPRYNPRYTPFRDPRVRLQTTKMADASLNKTTQLGERYRVQFRAEVFNLANSFYNTRAQFDHNPESPNFGTLIKAAVSAPESSYPRQIQLAVKFIW